MPWPWPSLLRRQAEGRADERDFRILEFSNFATPLTDVLKSKSILIFGGGVVTFQENLVDTVRQGLCNTLSIAQRTAQLGERFYGTVGLRPIADASGQAAQLWSNAAGLACNRVPQDLSNEVVPPFQGGQCPGVRYSFTRTVEFPPNPPGTPRVFNSVLGPLQYVERVTDQRRITEVLDGEGEVVSSASTDLDNAQPIINVFNVVRDDGLPDDCGNPPAQGPEYNPVDFTLPRTINFDDDGGNPQSINVDLVYKPVNTNESGDFVVPIDVEFEDGSSLFGDFNLTTGDINFGGGNTDGDGVTNEPTELEDNEENVPEGLVVVGCRVIVAIDENASRATEIFGDGSSPNLFVPRLGTIRFRYQAPGGGATLGPDISVKQRNELFWSGPVAIGVAVQEDIGSQFTVRLIVVKESAVGLFGGGGST